MLTTLSTIGLLLTLAARPAGATQLSLALDGQTHSLSAPTLIAGEDAGNDGGTLGVGARVRLDTDIDLALSGRVYAGMGAHYESMLSGGASFVSQRQSGQLEVGVESGLHGYSGFSRRFLSTPVEDPGVTLPFVGAIASWNSLRGQTCGFSLSGFAGRDLGRERLHTAWGGLFGVHSEADYEVGGWYAGLGFGVIFAGR